MQEIIKEFHVSPWVLPKETMVGWVKWSPDESIRSIAISTDPNVVFTQLMNVIQPVPKIQREVIVDSSNLEVKGFLGFVAYFDIPPQTEIDIEFKVRLIGDSREIVPVSRTVRIVRPVLLFIVSDSFKVSEKEVSTPQFKFQLVNTSSAEAIDVRPNFSVECKPDGAIEIITENVSSVLESAPIRLLRLSQYISKIKVKRPAVAQLKLSFDYKDRIGNIYHTPFQNIEIDIRASTIKEVPITNVIKGDADPVEIPLAAPLIA